MYFVCDPKLVVYSHTKQKQMQILFLRKHFQDRPQEFPPPPTQKNSKEKKFTAKKHKRYHNQMPTETAASRVKPANNLLNL